MTRETFKNPKFLILGMDYHKFFGRESNEVARDLLGRLLVRNTEKGSTSGRIVQTGAYEGGNGTPTRAGMKYPPGTLFLMKYRNSYLFNIATGEEGKPSCVEVRELAFHNGRIEGPGAVTKFFEITPDLDGILLGDKIEILGDSVDESEVKRVKGTSDNCRGYFLVK